MSRSNDLPAEALRHDSGTGRDYLFDQAVFCGAMLRLKVQALKIGLTRFESEWVWARYEMFRDTRRGYLIGPDERIIRIDGSERARWPETWEQ
jgi:hypothetical protein